MMLRARNNRQPSVSVGHRLDIGLRGTDEGVGDELAAVVN